MRQPKDPIPMSLFGERIKELRIGAKLSQQAVADRLCIDRTTYTKYETGRASPDHQGLLCLAEVFGVTVDYLLGREEGTILPVTNGDAGEPLSIQEKVLVQMYRQLTPEEQAALFVQAQKVFDQKRKQNL